MPVCRNSSSGELATSEVWHGSYADAVHASCQLKSSPTEKEKKKGGQGLSVAIVAKEHNTLHKTQAHTARHVCTYLS